MKKDVPVLMAVIENVCSKNDEKLFNVLEARTGLSGLLGGVDVDSQATLTLVDLRRCTVLDDVAKHSESLLKLRLGFLFRLKIVRLLAFRVLRALAAE